MNKIKSDAHRLVMNHTTYGNYEYNAEGKFLDGCFSCGFFFFKFIINYLFNLLFYFILFYLLNNFIII